MPGPTSPTVTWIGGACRMKTIPSGSALGLIEHQRSAGFGEHLLESQESRRLVHGSRREQEVGAEVKTLLGVRAQNQSW